MSNTGGVTKRSHDNAFQNHATASISNKTPCTKGVSMTGINAAKAAACPVDQNGTPKSQIVRLKFSKGTSKAVTNIIQGGTPPDAANMQPESNTPALDNLVKDVKTMGERLENATDEYRQKLKSERAETMSARQALATEQVKGQAQKRLLENSQNLAEKAHRENLHLRASNSKLVSQVREVHDRCAALQNQCAAMLAEYGEED